MIALSPEICQDQSDLQDLYSSYRTPRNKRLDAPSVYLLIKHRVYPYHIPHDQLENRGMLRVGANRIKVQIPREDQRGGGVRGVITGFSAASRKRLIDLVNLWRNTDDMVFVTLTYHNDWSEDWRDWKRQLDNFIKRLRYHYPDARGVWRLEYQKRGAPHFHLMIAGMPDLLQGIIKDVTEWWGEIAHAESEYHGLYATKCERIQNRRKANYYVSKYVAKIEENAPENQAAGRMWGRFGDIDTDEIVIPMLVENLIAIRSYIELVLETVGHKYAHRLKEAPHGLGWSVYGVGDCGEENTISWADIRHGLMGV